MRNKVQINNDSIENTVKKNYQEALTEYILNAFEADASEIEIVSTCNGLGGVSEIRIIDNGTGIDRSNLSQTFESFLTSNKIPLLKPIHIGKNKGKGRYSFIGFANSATWNTIYRGGDRLLSYSIRISAPQIDYVDIDENVEDVTDKRQNTGTTVILRGTDSLSNEHMELALIEKPLLSAFAYFLYLKKSNGYKITINGKQLDYKKLIDDNLSEDKTIIIDGESFSVYFVKWLDNIKSRYFFYFLDDTSREKYYKHTSFNNNAIEFCHSVYIESSYFNDFIALPDDKTSEEQTFLCEADIKNQRSETFKKLLKALDEFVESKLKQFVKKDADRLIEKMESEGVFPKFGDDAFGQERKVDLINVVKTIYCVEPRVFKGLKMEPQKSILGFLNLLLSTNERENIIKIIEEVTQLTAEERSELTEILRYTKLSNVLRTIKLITNRLQVIELLKTLIHNNAVFATERDHIQKVVQENYWLFGEEFHLVTADKNFEKALAQYLHIVDGETDGPKYSLPNSDKLRRPDIFICQQRVVDNLDGSQLEQNIIVELKAPQTALSKKIHRQIEDYMDFIMKEPSFNSQSRDWRFIAVCKSVDNDIKGLYKAFENYNKRFLTHKVGNYEIYSMTWDDVFTSYRLRYSHLLKKMDINKQALCNSLNAGEPSRETADALRGQIIDLAHQS